MTVSIVGKRIQSLESSSHAIAGAIDRVLTLVLQGAGAAAFSLGSGFNEALFTDRNRSASR